jgi:hypothetical protein
MVSPCGDVTVVLDSDDGRSDKASPQNPKVGTRSEKSATSDTLGQCPNTVVSEMACRYFK